MHRLSCRKTFSSSLSQRTDFLRSSLKAFNRSTINCASLSWNFNNNNNIHSSCVRSYATIRLVDHQEERKKQQQQQQSEQQQGGEHHDENSQQTKKEPFMTWTQFIFFGIPAITTFCLGVWQTKRYLWKKEQIALREVTLAQDPIEYDPSKMLKISENIQQPESSVMPSIHEKSEEDYDPIHPARDEYSHRIITLEGYFDYDKEIVVGLRKSPLTKRLDLPTSVGEMGFFILTPFVTKQGEVVMVNRGWVPQSIYKDPSKASKQDFEKKATDQNHIEKVTAIIRPGEYLGAGISDSYDGKSNKFIAMDLFSIAKYYKLPYIPLLVDAFYHIPNFVYSEKQTSENSLKASKAQESKYPMVAIPDDYMKFYITPATHVAYMVTWYTLCMWIIGSLVYLKRKKRLSNF
ncbi:hypothetical protein C9374_006561 [Naegleria lovaniensis]|uniref:SURF1-like protein n=1 Tax=Naegleria lovaniensis TaxID=51637 RepID=A0AA88GL01_NAELO|nr:uncharacterized protein C9374_006561 [Naegleria lovaniensis]KAG2379444.1 hypothetical protein C9374_006561 [Naegleria lovaniensis]